MAWRALGPMTSSPGMGPDPHLSWVVHPLLQESPLKSAALVGAIAGFSLVAALSLEGTVYGLVSLLVLALSTARYFLPTRYSVDEAGVSSGLLNPRPHPWREFARADERPDGLLLSPFVRPSRLDSYRGVYLRFAPDTDGPAVTALAKSRVQAQVQVQHDVAS